MKYYTCENCHFQFERVGECYQCPDCGKERVRSATKQEIETYLKIREEFNSQHK